MKTSTTMTQAVAFAATASTQHAARFSRAIRSRIAPIERIAQQGGNHVGS